MALSPFRRACFVPLAGLYHRLLASGPVPPHMLGVKTMKRNKLGIWDRYMAAAITGLLSRGEPVSPEYSRRPD